MNHAETLRQMADDLRDNHREGAATALLAGAEALEREQWRPIDTAPRDAEVFLYFPKTGTSIGFWAQLIGCWMVGYETVANQPTHWRPLPPGPEASRNCGNCSEERCHINHDGWQGPCPEWTTKGPEAGKEG